MIALTAALTLALPMTSGGGEGEGSAPPLSKLRYTEDYTGLAETAAAEEWWARYKDVALDRRGLWRLSFGLELRAQSETFRGDGLRPEEDLGLEYIWWRALPTFDLRGDGVRAFTQFILATASGLDAEPSPIDDDRGDLLQGFIEVPFDAGSGVATLRGGRRLLSYGSERLVGNRYGPNVPLAFDGFQAAYETDGFEAEALWVRPVQTRADDFDDSSNDARSLFGLYTTTTFDGHGLDLYYLGNHDDGARYDAGVADERRHTFGARSFGHAGAADWNAEIFGQFGDFGDQDIRAWSATLEAGLRPAGADWRVFARGSVISGDQDPGDDELGTFDPLFPRGKYFGEIGTIGPSNLIDALVGVQLELAEGWSLEASTNGYWRHSTADGIYANNGPLLRTGSTSDERFVGIQGDVALIHQVSRTVSWTVSYSMLDGGPFLEDTGPSSPLHFYLVSAQLLF